MVRRPTAAALLSVLWLVALQPALGAPAGPAAGLELVGVFGAGAPLNGANFTGERFYATTADRLSIFDASQPTLPILLSSVASPNVINGEQLSTNDELLLLNSFESGSSLDVWNVEDATNPVVEATVSGVPDEHVSCVLDCTWAYGSDGTVIDLRRPGSPEEIELNWKEELGISKDIHRLDEFRYGFAAVAPRRFSPFILDVRDPRRPRIVARSTGSNSDADPFLYAEWPRKGRGPFLIASIEGAMTSRCDGEEAILVSFDTSGWPQRRRFVQLDRYQSGSARGCVGVYFSKHPRFSTTGLLVLAAALDGMRVVRIGGDGRFTEMASFEPVVGDIWHSYWIDEEIVYVPNRTGEIYILRYVP